MTKKALIFGISGQDGALLARHLLERGYVIHGTSRDKELSTFTNLARVGIRECVGLHSASLTDFRSVLQVIADTTPSEIYNLAGQSSVGLSFGQPVETLSQRRTDYARSCYGFCLGLSAGRATSQAGARPMASASEFAGGHRANAPRIASGRADPALT